MNLPSASTATVARPVREWERTPRLVSIVAPVFREEAGLARFVECVVETLRGLDLPFEIILIEDDSPDRSWAVIRELVAQHPDELRAISLSRRFGHQASLAAGFQRARGEVVICMDSDLQHPPALLATLLDHWAAGAQVVYTRRQSTRGRSWAAELASSWFYRTMNSLSDVSFEEGTADFRLMDRVVVDALVACGERSPVFRGLVAWAGFRRVAVDYVAAERFAGTSQYSWRRMLRLAVDCLFAFSLVPLRFGYYLGSLGLLAGMVYSVWTLAAWLAGGREAPGYTSLVLLITFLGSLNLLCIGIVGEYIGRVHEQVKGRPLYLVKESLGWRDETSPISQPTAPRPHFMAEPSKPLRNTA